MNEKVGPDDEPVFNPNTTDALLVTAAGVDAANAVDDANAKPVEEEVDAAAAVDAVKGNTVEGDEAATEAGDAMKENPVEGNAVVGTEAVEAGKENAVMGDVVPATGAVDAAKDEPAEADLELNAEVNKEDLVGCQLELNKLEVVPPMALLELASEEEAEELTPKEVPELESPEAGVEAANRELPEEKAVFPANPNETDGTDELNGKDAAPVPAGDACALSTDPLPVPKTVELGLLLAVEVSVGLNAKMLLPALAFAAEVPIKGELLRLPKLLSGLVLAASDSIPKVAVTGDAEDDGIIDPDLNIGDVENEGAATEEVDGVLLLLMVVNAVVVGVVVLLLLVEVTVSAELLDEG